MGKFYYLMVLITIFFSACTNPEMPCLNGCLATIHFVNKDSMNTPYYNRDILKKFTAIHGLGVDQNLLFDTTASASAYYTVPLDNSKNNSTFIFEGKTKKDTIVIEYERGTEKCGSSKNPNYVPKLYNLKSNKYTFDSVAVDNAYNEIKVFL